MSQDWFDDVFTFSRKFHCHLGAVPAMPPRQVCDLRLRLVAEEANELRIAMERHDLPEVADACADLVYVTVGTALAFGIDLRAVWDAVQAANMAKVNGKRRDDGKILKPIGWKPPDIATILTNQDDLSKAPSAIDPAWMIHG